MKQSVTLRGTKEGYHLLLDDRAAFENILDDLEILLTNLKNKKTAAGESEEILEIIISTGSRRLNEKEKTIITEKIESKQLFEIKKFESDVVEISQALGWHERNQTKIETKNVRSGQTLSVAGNLLLLGDIHQGGIVKAGGSIIVLGQLKGLAQAGAEGDDRSIVVANFQYNSQIRIGENVHIIEKNDPADSPEEEKNNPLKVAYMNDLHILEFTELKNIGKLRPELGNVVGRLE